MGKRMALLAHALRHSADGEFSAVLAPNDCKLLLTLIDHYYELLQGG
jgi:hypothetical protein